MNTNTQFLDIIKESFEKYLDVGTSRSTSKLKCLHGAIAEDLKEELGSNYQIKSQGYDDDKEGTIDGRYYPKNVDITIYHNNKAVAGYAVKFVMRNYSQNSNNYFENMLGETANLRANSVPYFQVFIIFDKVPYYKKGGEFARYDEISSHNLEKYIKLSEDNPQTYFHTPDKVLLILLTLKEKQKDYQFKNEEEYAKYYLSKIKDNDLVTFSKKIKDSQFGNPVVINDYQNFILRTVFIIKGNQK